MTKRQHNPPAPGPVPAAPPGDELEKLRAENAALREYIAQLEYEDGERRNSTSAVFVDTLRQLRKAQALLELGLRARYVRAPEWTEAVRGFLKMPDGEQP